MDVRNNKDGKKKGFWAKLLEKLDKKLETEAQKTDSCCGPHSDPSQQSGDSCRG